MACSVGVCTRTRVVESQAQTHSISFVQLGSLLCGSLVAGSRLILVLLAVNLRQVPASKLRVTNSTYTQRSAVGVCVIIPVVVTLHSPNRTQHNIQNTAHTHTHARKTG